MKNSYGNGPYAEWSASPLWNSAESVFRCTLPTMSSILAATSAIAGRRSGRRSVHSVPSCSSRTISSSTDNPEFRAVPTISSASGRRPLPRRAEHPGETPMPPSSPPSSTTSASSTPAAADLPLPRHRTVSSSAMQICQLKRLNDVSLAFDDKCDVLSVGVKLDG